MADNIAEMRQFFRDNAVHLGQDDVWEVQKIVVVKHKALERLAAKLAIEWREPKILRCEADEAVILVIGAIGSHVEWSIGEARVVPMQDSGQKNKWGKPIYEPLPGAIGNYQITPKQSAYVWAMSEKRGKDRVIIKLAGIEAFSEEESDDFKSNRQADLEQDTGPTPSEIGSAAEKSLNAAAAKGTVALREAWMRLAPATRELFGGNSCPERFKNIAAKHDKKDAA